MKRTKATTATFLQGDRASYVVGLLAAGLLLGAMGSGLTLRRFLQV